MSESFVNPSPCVESYLVELKYFTIEQSHPPPKKNQIPNYSIFPVKGTGKLIELVSFFLINTVKRLSYPILPTAHFLSHLGFFCNKFNKYP